MKYITLVFLLITNITYASGLNLFNSKTNIKSSEINENFLYFQDFLVNDFQLIKSKQVIEKSIFSDFSSNLDCTSSVVLSDKIISNEINNYFSNISCLFPQNKFYDINCNCYKNIPYFSKNDSLNWVIDGSLNTGVGQRKMDVYLPQDNLRNGKVMFYFHPLTEKKELVSSFSQSIKNNFINQGYVFISVEFRHPAVEGYSSIADQFDISIALEKLKKNINFGNYDENEIYAIAYSKGSLVLANILDSRYSNYSDLKIKKLYILDAQITYNEDTYYNLYIDKNDILYEGFFNITVSARIAFDSLNEGAKSFVGLQLINDTNAVDSYRSLFNSLNMASKTNLPIIRFGYNLQRSGNIYVNSILTSLIPININPANLDYLLHNPMSIDIFCNEYNKYGTCSGQDNLQYSLTNIMNDINGFF